MPSLNVKRTGVFLALPVTVRLVFQLISLVLKLGAQLDLSGFVSCELGTNVQWSFRRKRILCGICRGAEM